MKHNKETKATIDMKNGGQSHEVAIELKYREEEWKISAINKTTAKESRLLTKQVIHQSRITRKNIDNSILAT